MIFLSYFLVHFEKSGVIGIDVLFFVLIFLYIKMTICVKLFGSFLKNLLLFDQHKQNTNTFYIFKANHTKLVPNPFLLFFIILYKIVKTNI